MEVLYPHCAGLDIHKETVVACVRHMTNGTVKREVCTFKTMTSDLLALSEWLASEGCTHVVMEATGIYWKPRNMTISPSRATSAPSARKGAVSPISHPAAPESPRPNGSCRQVLTWGNIDQHILGVFNRHSRAPDGAAVDMTLRVDNTGALPTAATTAVGSLISAMIGAASLPP